jgi:hypothetical protein
MSDDKSKRGAPDRSKISGTESYEVEYAAQQLQPKFPGKTMQEIKRAIVESTQVKEFHNNRQMIMNSARLKLMNK